MKKPLVVFGTGEIGEIAHYYFSKDSDREVAAFAADRERIRENTFCGLPVVAFEDLNESHPPAQFDMFVALSYAKLNRVRQSKYDEAKAKGYTLASYISSRSVCWDNAFFGDNCFILENQTVQPFCRIGNNVTLWSGNHIGHHSTIGDHTFVSSHVVISGMCTIGARCFFGVNATFRDNCSIGDEVFVGMGASVTKDVAGGEMVLGASDDVIPADDRRARAIRRSYFGI
tara:strand:- start:21228 stop:21914 length:687 start_codon:yes stop_codon:yes gene_type:complete